MGVLETGPTVLLGIPHKESADALGDSLSAAGCAINRVETVGECESLLQTRGFELVVLDMSLNGSDGIDAVGLCRRSRSLLSRSHLIFTSSGRAVTSDDLNIAMSVGARDVVETPVSAAMIEQLARLAADRHSRRISSVSAGGSRTGIVEAPGDENGLAHRLSQSTSSPGNNGGPCKRVQEPSLAELENMIVGDSPSMTAIRHLILEVAPTRASVMIYGESGTGKELVAQAIHQYSKFAHGPFVPVNMAAIPPGLAESMLFGHEKGVFTSAVHNQSGWCEAANGGTLFLDEVGDMELQVQPKLLRFLQHGSFQRVGSQASRPVTVRMITATNCDPRTMVSDGRMREDLFFRLHVVPVYVPPLRDRPEDIPKLAMLFLRRAAERHDRAVEEFSDDALRVLQEHDWPGNVRQLENTIERLVVFARGRIVEADQIPAEDQLASAYAGRRRAMAGEAAERGEGDDFDPMASLTPIERHERAAIIDALRRVDGHVIDAARLLGLGQATVYRKIKQYVIPNERKRRLKRPK
jgi:DNA-binding NtrC family response regulator